MTTLTPTPVFSFHAHQIRTALIDKHPWFTAKDVCAALGIKWNGRATLLAIPSDWQRVWKLHTHQRGLQSVLIINEPAVYKLAFRSNKPEADAFTNWVASEVLPAIRKTGKYEAKPRTKALPAPQPAQVPALKLQFPLHDYNKAVRINRDISRKTTILGLDLYDQFKAWTEEAACSFTHEQRRCSIMDQLDFVVHEQEQSMKRLGDSICENILAFSQQCRSLALLAQLMREQEKMMLR